MPIMKLLQRVANKLGLVTKAQLRSAMAGYQAAAINRLTSDWTSSNLSADSTIRMSLETLRARSRQLAENNDYGRAFMGMIKNNVVGEQGVLLKNKAKDPPSRNNPDPELDKFANRIIEDYWWEWNQRGQCTVDRSMCGIDLQNLAIETAGKDGEVLLRKVRGFDNPHRYAIQVLESDYLDVDLNERLPGDREIRMGVELDRWKAPIAYWLLKRHPNDTYFQSGNILERSTRVPAEDIIHGFIKFRPEQTRGIPWMATSMYRLNMLGKYEEAETTAARTAACKMAFFTKNGANIEYTGEPLPGGGKQMDAEPANMEELPMGMDVKVVDWNHPNTAYQVFVKTALRGVASGLGVSYNTLGNDMESVNFASGQIGIKAEREAFKAIQRWFIDSIWNEIFKDWLMVQLLNQTIPLPFSKFDKFNSPTWRPRRWPSIDPEKEARARILNINSGLASISGYAAEDGKDRDELFDEIMDDKEAAESRGIHFSEIKLDDPVEEEKELMAAKQENQPTSPPPQAE